MRHFVLPFRVRVQARTYCRTRHYVLRHYDRIPARWCVHRFINQVFSRRAAARAGPDVPPRRVLLVLDAGRGPGGPARVSLGPLCAAAAGAHAWRGRRGGGGRGPAHPGPAHGLRAAARTLHALQAQGPFRLRGPHHVLQWHHRPSEGRRCHSDEYSRWSLK